MEASMDANLQRRIQRYGWDKAADLYETGWRESLARVQAELLELAAAEPGEQVLDVACGTGLVTFPLAERVGPTGRVFATDISERMVEALRARAEAMGHTQVEALRADAEAHPMLADASIDLVTCALGLMYFADPLQAMREAARVLKPGGRAVFAVWGARANCGWAEIFPIVDARVHSEVCPMFFRLGTGNTLAREVERAGLRVTVERRIATTLPYADDAAALCAAFAGGPVALAYHRFDAEVRDAAHADYLASIARYRTDQGYRLPGEFVVCIAVRPA